MNKKKFCFVLVIFLLLSPLLAQNEENFVGNHIVSLDICTMGLSNLELGWGLGVNYEQQILKSFAVKGGFNHWTMFPFNQDFNYILSVGIFLEALYYPFGNGLDKLYFGLGNGTEFIMYNGANIPENKSKDTPISLIGQIGWKQNIYNYLMIDIFCGYRYVINSQEIYEPTKKYVSQGFQYGIKTKFNLSKIIAKIKQLAQKKE